MVQFVKTNCKISLEICLGVDFLIPGNNFVPILFLSPFKGCAVAHIDFGLCIFSCLNSIVEVVLILTFVPILKLESVGK